MAETIRELVSDRKLRQEYASLEDRSVRIMPDGRCILSAF